MHHLETVFRETRFAECAQPTADGELIHLRVVEVEKTQRQRLSRIVDDRDAQLRPVAKTFFDRLDAALHLRAFAVAKIADCGDARAIFVAQRQVEP